MIDIRVPVAAVDPQLNQPSARREYCAEADEVLEPVVLEPEQLCGFARVESARRP